MFSSFIFLFCFLVQASRLVQCANPDTSQYFTLVGCDDHDIDTAMLQAVDMLRAALEAIDQILDGPIDRTQVESTRHLSFAARIWGTAFQELDGGVYEISQESRSILDGVRDRYIDIGAALTNVGLHFKPELHYLFCGESRFIPTAKLSDWAPGAAGDDADPDTTGELIYWYPPAGINDLGFAKLWRRDLGCEVSNTAAIAAYTNSIPFAERATDGSFTKGKYLVLCDLFFTEDPPRSDLSNSIPLDDWDLRKYDTQTVTLLHEFMHSRFDDIDDVEADLSETNSIHAGTQKPVYGVVDCSLLALLKDRPGCGPRAAIINADNYALYALGAWLPYREWDFQKMYMAQMVGSK